MKLYADEAGHEAIRSLRDPLVVSALARVEVPAAIWRKQRMGEIDIDDTLTLVRAFEVDYAGPPDGPPRFVAVEVSHDLLERGARLAADHGLRAYDAVQLASAIVTRDLDKHCETLATFDRGLMRAAISEGFRPFPPAQRQSTATSQ